jgi:hypothetical protein
VVAVDAVAVNAVVYPIKRQPVPQRQLLKHLVKRVVGVRAVTVAVNAVVYPIKRQPVPQRQLRKHLVKRVVGVRAAYVSDQVNRVAMLRVHTVPVANVSTVSAKLTAVSACPVVLFYCKLLKNF